MKTSKCSLCLLVTTFSVVASIHSHAQTILWAGATNSVWSTSANWVGNVVPTDADDVTFNVTTGLAGGFQVNTSTSNPTAKSITVDLASFRFNADNSRTLTLGNATTAGSFILTEKFTTGSSVFDANSTRSLGVTFYDNLNLINRGTGLASVGLVGPVRVQTRLDSSGVGTITFGGNGSWSFLPQSYLGKRAADSTQTLAVVLSGSGPDIFNGVLEYGSTTASNLDTLVINSGTYRLSNNATTIASSGVTVGAGGTLGGNGTIGGAVTVAGTLAPGLSPGTLNFTDNLTLNSTATLQLEVTGIGAGQFDILNGDGANTLTLGGILAIDNTGYSATFGDSITVFTNWSSITGTFDSITGTGLGGGLSWDTSSLYSAGILTVIPEPSTTTLLLGAGIFIATLLRRRSRLA